MATRTEPLSRRPSPSYASASAMPATNPRRPRRWSDAYLTPRKVELRGRLNALFGVDLFKRTVVAIGRAMGRRADSPNSHVMAANLYPVILQRATRVRLDHCLRRMQARAATD